MHIEAPKNTIKKSAEAVFIFLTDLQNFEKIMPDNIEKFEIINEDRFLFALKGMPEIVLQRKEQNPNDKLVLGAASDKLTYTLTANISSITYNECEVTFSFNGEFNAMMAMMIKSPITNLIGTLSNNLTTI
ncbi:MAG: SRPBCC family protein [Maribacter sp.]|nr:SRPBCC family protein [Maribacter sp.]NNK17817.1 SRPBCC family protein [Maribacter sp.]NNK74473.1 SRPBCC family protein [Maribacter sp.]